MRDEMETRLRREMSRRVSEGGERWSVAETDAECEKDTGRSRDAESMIERKPFVHTAHRPHAPHALGPVMLRSAFGGSSAFATDAKAAVTIASIRDGSFSFAAASRFAA